MSTLVAHYIQLVGMAKTWAVKNLVGWSDESHRDLLARHGAKAVDGRVSARTLGAAQLGAVLDDYERRGWPRQRPAAAGDKAKPVPEKVPVPARIKTLVRLWGKLEQAGKVKKSSREALLAFCARQTMHEVRDLDSLTVPECQKITEALKGWLGRE